MLDTILRTGEVTDGTERLPLLYNMDAAEGALVERAFGYAFSGGRGGASLEVGCAYGVSALFACRALARLKAVSGETVLHHIVDPAQSGFYRGIGLRNLQLAGHGERVRLHEEGSQTALPRLLGEGLRVRAAVVDGMHTFDHTLVDFFYVNKMLEVGGVVILDDVHFPGVARVAAHILTYPAYRLFGEVPDRTAFALRTRVRRALSRILPPLRQPWDVTCCLAFEKVAEDERPSDWHIPF